MTSDRLPAVDLPFDPAGRRREQRSFPGVAGSVPQARRFALEVLTRWRMDELHESGALLVTELATNAVLHASSRLQVDLVQDGSAALLIVTDFSPAPPRLRPHRRDASTGRGLRLVERLSAAHGVRLVDGGKQVWALLCPEDGADPGSALTRSLDGVEPA